ncbi:MAG: pilus assembly protein [Candidatus Cohnella colombiensis]|uniref:Pilus assembly protein n=1 Tax=Candidatus Cohnella colombiensis TaxID=3121368 RepID=A0AA95JDK7_9BACL|nr:MAG: pilus assembly protein [Cohnella sp.]
MKQHISQIAPINSRLKSSEGSVTLEAAMVMPLFLMLIVFLIFLVKTAVISMALHGALSQTVRQSAAMWYPISLGIEQVRGTAADEKLQQWNEKLSSVGEMMNEVGPLLPSPMKEWAEQASYGRWSIEGEVAKLAFAQLMKQFVDDRVLNDEKIQLINVELPSDYDRSKANLTIRAQYTLPFQVPFLDKKLVLREYASERVWIGGTPSQSRIVDDDVADFTATFVSLDPNPAQPGRKVTLTIRVKPNETVDLSVFYKSGQSQAKHLGEATADASGLVSWTWLVSGRTTPGEWNLKVNNSEGASWDHYFQVQGKDKT